MSRLLLALCLLGPAHAVDECARATARICDHKCVDQPIGFKCECYEGYRVNPADPSKCLDINECTDPKEIPKCSQYCENKVGSFKCTCNSTFYELAADKVRCKLKSPEPIPWLVLANRHYIRNLTMDGSNYGLMSKGFDNAVSLDYDLKERMLYIADIGKQRLLRMNWETANPNAPPKTDVLLRHNVFGMEGLAIDWVGRKLYYLNRQERTLRVCELDGGHCRVLLRNRFTQPRSLAAFPSKGYLFFTEWSLSPYIARIGMDGSEFTKILEKDLGWPNAITVDLYSEKVYWGDAHLNELGFANLDGSNRQHVPVLKSPHIFSIAVFDDWVYWSDWNLKEVLRAHKFTGKDEQLLEKTIQLPNDLQVIHPARQPESPNPCGSNNGGCSHLCLLKPGGLGFSCLCPDFFAMQPDGKTCLANCTQRQWKCSGDDRCIPNLWRCDGERDCTDGSDEAITCPARICRPGEFQCDNHNCTRSFQLCDGSDDCGDGSDERDCDKACDPWHFKCNNTGRCIPDRFLCDGDDDCHDNSDEDPRICQHPDRKCTDEEFRCNNNKCINKAWVCDFDDDCGDRSDEMESCKTNDCPTGWSRCAESYRCIPNWAYCNGHDDCRDNSDEMKDRCPACDPVGDFRCSGSQKCVPRRWLCDGENDCGDNSDEEDPSCGGTSRPCSESEFRCGDGKCVRGIQVCDGEPQCADASDEANCLQRPCAFEFKKCADGTCVRESLWCDRRKDCADASDEADCTGVQRRTCSPLEYTCANSVCIPKKFMCDGDDDCGDRSDETNPECVQAQCDPPLRFRCQFSKLCLNILRLCNGHDDCSNNATTDHSDETLSMCRPLFSVCDEKQFKCSNKKCINESSVCNHRDDCGDQSDENGCHKGNATVNCNSKGDNGGCAQHCSDLSDGGYYCHCRHGFAPSSRDPKACDDVDECKGNNTCSQLCINEKGSYACDCRSGFTDAVHIGGMKGKDCRADGEPLTILYASENAVAQVDLSKRHLFNPRALYDPASPRSEIIAIDFDPVTNMTFWIDRAERQVRRSTIPRGNQTHQGQVIDINFHAMGDLVPTSLAVDHVSGNLYIGATTALIARSERGRNKRQTADDPGKIIVVKSDGRYAYTLIKGNVVFPTALAIDAELGLLVWADAGSSSELAARIEVADLDGRHRKVIADELIFYPTSVAIDTTKDHRVYWADPKEGRIDSVKIDGAGRLTIYRAAEPDRRVRPYKLDVFENWIYWLSQDTNQLLKMDKFGHGLVEVLRSGIREPHAVKALQSQRYNRTLERPCRHASCSHLCLTIPGLSFVCACPDGSDFQRTPGGGKSPSKCTAQVLNPLDAPEKCGCLNGGLCQPGAGCKCMGDWEGTNCGIASGASKRSIGGGIGIGTVLWPLILVLLVVCVLGGVAYYMYRRQLLFFKKKELASSSVSYHGNVVSFTNPVLDHKMGEPSEAGSSQSGEPSPLPPKEYNLSSAPSDSTNFTNPVYDIAGPDHAHVSASGEGMKRQKSLDPTPGHVSHDKAALVTEDVSDV